MYVLEQMEDIGYWIWSPARVRRWMDRWISDDRQNARYEFAFFDTSHTLFSQRFSNVTTSLENPRIELWKC